MKDKIKFTKEKLELFLLTELLIYKSYNNRNLSLEKSCKDISKTFCDFYKFDVKSEHYKPMYNFAKTSIEYMEKLSTITSMYSTFEQFLKVSLKFPKSEGSLKKKINKACEPYKYNVEENSFFEKIEKYRMLNNSIKHGSINNDLLEKYPNLVNKNCNINEFGTILDSPFNITDDDIIECYTSLCRFIEEMYCYFEDSGYIN